MTDYAVTESEMGAQEKTLAANTVDKVTFGDDVNTIEVVSEGGAALYFTVNGTDPVVGSSKCHCIPAAGGVREIEPSGADKTVVKLIAGGAVTYFVARVSK